MNLDGNDPQITPEMIQAGVLVAWGDSEPPEFVRQQVRAIFSAMWRARSTKGYWPTKGYWLGDGSAEI